MFTDLIQNDVKILFLNIKDVGPEYCPAVLSPASTPFATLYNI
jgi:hypothetical protein